MAINARENMVRTSAYLPKSYKAWLEKESSETGLTISNIIVMAVNQYIDQKDYMRLFPIIDQRLKELQLVQSADVQEKPKTRLEEIEVELNEKY